MKQERPWPQRVQRTARRVGKSVREHQRLHALSRPRGEPDPKGAGKRFRDDRELLGRKLFEQRDLEVIVIRELRKAESDETKAGRRGSDKPLEELAGAIHAGKKDERVQYAFSCRRPCRRVMKRIFTSSISDQFSM